MPSVTQSIIDRSRNIRTVSLFTGCGGLDVGFNSAGFRVEACVEIEEYACKTLRRNNPECLVIGPPDYDGDIKALPADEFMQLAGISPGDIGMLIGGPPCQPFSIAANQRFRRVDTKFKRLGFDDPKRGDLVKCFVDYVVTLKPDCFLLENVPGLRDVDGGKQLESYLLDLREAGYSISTPTILNATDFGVPQFRQRLFVTGVRKANAVPTLPVGFGASRTVVHALASMPQGLHNHVTREHKNESVMRYRMLSFGKRERLGRVDRLDPRLPSKTVIAGGSGGGGRSHLHPYIARTLSVRECARLQTFNDDYIFEGSTARQFTQVGNAVPPLFAQAIARHIGREVFGLPAGSGTALATYLERDQDLETLCLQLWQESMKQKPEWVYLDSVDCEPCHSGFKSDMKATPVLL